MDESSRTVKVRIQVNNDDGSALGGDVCGGQAVPAWDDETLAVPRDAILEDEGRFFAFVHHHGDTTFVGPSFRGGRGPGGSRSTRGWSRRRPW